MIIRSLITYEDAIYPAPEKTGALEITGYEGTMLQLVSETGYTYQFDVMNGVYLDQLESTPMSEKIMPSSTIGFLLSFIPIPAFRLLPTLWLGT